jgi:hypothetical protein
MSSYLPLFSVNGRWCDGAQIQAGGANGKEFKTALLSLKTCPFGSPITPFTSVPNRAPLDTFNPIPAAITDPALRRDALASARMRFDVPDKCPEVVLNQILWRAQKGTKAAYPQWAVLSNPSDKKTTTAINR